MSCIRYLDSVMKYDLDVHSLPFSAEEPDDIGFPEQ
jgi:hypothetical protein